MPTLKEDLYSACEEVVTTFPDWSFSAGKFRNRSLKHTELLLDLGLTFRHEFVYLQPWISLKNRQVARLSKQLIGEARPTVQISFHSIAHLLESVPERFHVSAVIYKDKPGNISAIRNSGAFSISVIEQFDAQSIDVKEAKPLLAAVVQDGIAFIERAFDLRDEESFLKGLPAKYASYNQVPYDELERMKGVVLCIVKLLLGDFSFFEQYQREDFKTLYPKREDELKKIAMAMPELRRRYLKLG